MSTTTEIAAALRPALVTSERAHLVALAEHDLIARDAAHDGLNGTAAVLDPEATEAGIAEAALRIAVRGHMAGLKEAFLLARSALVDRAALERGRRVVVDGEAVNLSGLLLAHERVLARHTQRIGDLMGRLNLSPAGSELPAAARDRITALLGFAKADASARDALTARDHLVELAHLHAGTAASLARVHGELVALGGAEDGAPAELAAASAEALGAALALEAAGGDPLPQAERSWELGARVIEGLRALAAATPSRSIPADADDTADAHAQDAAEAIALDEVRHHRDLLNALGLQLADAALELDEAAQALQRG